MPLYAALVVLLNVGGVFDAPQLQSLEVVTCDKFGDLLVHLRHLLLKGAGGNAQRPVAEDDDLLKIIRSCNAYAMVFSKVVSGALDIGVGGFGLFCIFSFSIRPVILKTNF